MNMGLDWTAEKTSGIKERAKSALKSVVSKTSQKLMAKQRSNEFNFKLLLKYLTAWKRFHK